MTLKGSAIFVSGAKTKGDMKTYRKIVDAKRLLPVMQLPDFLHNEKVEIIITPLINRKKKTGKRKSAMGLLKDYADPALMEQEKQAID